MGLSKLHSVNEIFGFTFKILVHQVFRKLLDIQVIYEQM